MRRGTVFLVVVIGALALLPRGADAFVYWSSQNGTESTIGRANLDGSGVDPDLVSGIAVGSGVASDGSHIYWGESGFFPTAATIGRAETDGSDVDRDFLPATTFCGVFMLRADPEAIFWLKNPCVNGLFTIDRHDDEGFGPAGSGDYIRGFDVDDTYVYWSEGNHIARGLRSGESIDRDWLDLGAGNAGGGVAVNEDHVYWTAADPDFTAYGRSIGRASIDGSESSIDHEFIGGTSFDPSVPPGIAVQGGYLYWTNSPEPGSESDNGSIARATLRGSAVEQDFIPDVLAPSGLDVDYARSGCARAEAALQRALDRLEKLRDRSAPRRAIKNAKRVVRKKRAAVAAACT